MARKRYAIPQYGTVIMAGKEYYRTRIEDADGKRVALYGRTREELYDKVLEAREQIEDADQMCFLFSRRKQNHQL